MRVIAIAVVGTNNVIGDGHDQPFKFREDWDRFKALTMGHPIIMGRHTQEAMGRYLPGRTTIVVSRNPERVELSESEQAPSFVCGSVDTALELASSLDDVCFVCGGGQVYRNAWDHLSELDLTEVHDEASGSVTFPDVDDDEWRLLERVPRGEFDFTRRFPIIQTERMRLAPVHPGDLDEWVGVHTDPQLYRHAPEALQPDVGRQREALEGNTRYWLDRGLGYWIARDRVDDQLLGFGGVRPVTHLDGVWNLYYRFVPAAHGRGLAQEMSRAAVEMLSVIAPSAELRAVVRPQNEASRRVAEAIGLRLAGERRDESDQPQEVWAAPVADIA